MSRHSILMRQIGRFMLTATAAFVIVSCSTGRKVVANGYDATHSVDESTPQAGRPDSHVSAHPVQLLLSEAHSWKGTPYLWGGNDRDGVDCSGFVTQVYLNALGIKLPRTSLTQSQHCTPLEQQELCPGDLIFFSTDSSRQGEVSHVGLYIGERNMIHASSSRGVIVSSLDNTYYKRTFHSAGRVRELFDLIQNFEFPAAKSPVIDIVPDEKIDTPPAEIQTKKSKPAAPKAKPSAPKAKPVTAKAKPAQAASVSELDARQAFLNSLSEENIDSLYHAPTSK